MTDDLARTDAPELLSCPFCGGEAHIDGTSWTTRDGKDQAWATCRKCGTYGPSSTDAVAAWNRRAPTALAASPEVQALLREARAQGMEEAADWHDSEIAGLERRIEANNEYLARRHGEAGTHYHCSEANEACRSGIITHRTAASTIRTAAAARRKGEAG